MHRDQKNVDKYQTNGNNALGWPNGSRLCRGATRSAALRAGSARDSQPKATKGRWDGSNISAIPLYQQKPFRALLCLKKPLAKGKKCLLSVKWICPFHAEPIHDGVADEDDYPRIIEKKGDSPAQYEWDEEE